MEYKQLYFLKDKYCTAAMRTATRLSSGDYRPPFGLAIICPHCGSLWFFAPVVDREGVVCSPILAWQNYCGCRPVTQWARPGVCPESVLFPGPVLPLESLPPPLLRREWEVHERYADTVWPQTHP